MQKIFQEYGGVITTAMAIVALISVIGLLFTPGGTGWMDKAFKDVINGFVDKAEVAIEGEPSLDAPTITIDGSTLTITPTENAASYEIYNDDALLTTTAETTVDLSTYITEYGTYTVRVRALADGYKASGYTEVEYVFELVAGLYNANDELVASWDELVNTYGMKAETNYTSATYKTAASSPYKVLSKSALSSGVKMVMGDDVTTIGENAFRGCTSLTSVTIPDGVTSIGQSAFDGCTGMTSATFGENSRLTSIDRYAFYGCASLTSITIPDSVTYIASSAFQNCANLAYNQHEQGLYLGNENNPYHALIATTTTDIASFTFCEGAKCIAGSTFSYHASLQNIAIPDGVTGIGDSAFYDCTSLASVTIANSVATIGANAFSGCTSLTSVTIPNRVTSIGYRAFQSCASLSSVTFEGTVAQWNTITKGDEWNTGVPATEVVCTDGIVSLA